MTNEMIGPRELNWFGISAETIAAQYESDAALAEYMEGLSPNSTEFPPKGDYFWAAWDAEREQADLDREQYTADAWALLEENAYGRK